MNSKIALSYSIRDYLKIPVTILCMLLVYVGLAQASHAASWYDSGYLYRKQITINHTKVSGGSDLSNFPVLISLTDANLKNGGGGYVQNANGYDIVFTDSTGTTKLDHEIEKYVAGTGEIEMWVRIPTLSASTDTTIYMYFDNSSISTSQENKTGVWDSNFKGVWHMKESGNGTAGEYKDSTSNNNNGQGGGGTGSKVPVQATGKIGYGENFTAASTQYINVPNSTSINVTGANLTTEAWINITTQPPTNDLRGYFAKNGFSGGYRSMVYYNNGVTDTPFFQLTSPNSLYGSTSVGMNASTWYHVAQTYDGTKMCQYVNGVVDTTTFSRTGNVNDSSANPLLIGTGQNDNYWWGGPIDETRISDSARTAGWIATEYNNQNAPATFCSVGSTQINTASFLYRKQLTIDHTKVSGGSNLSNFPVLISMTDANLKNGGGGYVQSALGYDIVFTDSTGTTKLDHELEKYVAGTGEIAMWVRIPTLSASSDTTLYMYFDNSSISTSQENKTGVWDSSYLGVWHMNDNATNTAVAGSTANTNTGTNAANTSTKTTTSQIAGGLTYNGSSDNTNTTSAGTIKGQSQVTISAWVNTSTLLATSNHVIYMEPTNGGSATTRLALAISGNALGSSSKKFTLFGRTNDADASTIFIQNTTTLATSTWYYVVGVYDSIGGVNHLMINSIDQTNTVIEAAFSSTTPIHTPEIGEQADGSNFYGGTLDEVRVSNTARSADWIATEYNNQSSPATFYSVGVLTGNSTVSPVSNTCTVGASSDQTYTIALNGNTLSSVTNGGYTLVLNTDYTWSSPTLTLNASYLNALTTGSQTITLNMSGGTNPTISITVSAATWYDSNYLYRKQITIDHTKVSGGSNLSNFPVLISLIDANFKTTGNGGYVQNANGYDIVFTDGTGTTKLDHEIEKYVATTGEIEMWVRIPTLSASADTSISIYFDNSSISTSQENKTGVWDSHYKAVHHLKETSGTQYDSTSNANNFTDIVVTAEGTATGKIDGADQFNGATDYTYTPNMSNTLPSGPMTLDIWGNISSFNAGGEVFNWRTHSVAPWKSYSLATDGSHHAMFLWTNNSSTIYTAIGTTVLSTGTWYHLTGVYTGSAIKIYVNGVNDTSGGSVAITGTIFSSDGHFGINTSNSTYSLHGVADESRLSDVQRTDGWLTTEYNNQNSPLTFSSVGVLISAVAPVNVSGWPKVDTSTTSGFTVREKTNQNGTAYYVVVAGGATAPTAAETKAGTASCGGTALANGTFALTANTEGSGVVTALGANMTYDVYVVAQDASSNLQATATQVTAPTATTVATVVASPGPYMYGPQTDLSYTVTLSGKTLSSITNGGYTLVSGTNNDYTWDGTSALLLKSSYLSTLPVGDATLTLNMNAGGNPTIRLTVSKSDTWTLGTATDKSYTVILSGRTLSSIVKGFDDGYTLVSGTDYTWDGSALVLLASYLNTLPIGDCALTLITSAGRSITIRIVVSTPDAWTLGTATDKSYTLSLGFRSLDTIVNVNAVSTGGFTLRNTDYTWDGISSLVLKASYLNILPVGVNTITLSMSGGVTATIVLTVS